jgi:hypothetical protein
MVPKNLRRGTGFKVAISTVQENRCLSIEFAAMPQALRKLKELLPSSLRLSVEKEMTSML